MRLAAVILLSVVASASAGEPFTLELFPGGTPSKMKPVSEATKKTIQSYGGPQPNRITDVSVPTITVYRAEKPNGTAVIVAPGGGYMFLSWGMEGTQVCEWLNTLGVTGILLKYRTPTRDEEDPSTLPVQDGLRALGLVRHHAAEWSIDPKRVGVLGFSAGGNLVGHMAWDRHRTYEQDPKLDDPRGPDFLVFVYGGGFLDRGDTTKFRPGFSVPADAPPAFFIVAGDDKNNPVEAARLYLEYKRLNIPAELHIYAKGGHGFGMRPMGNPVNDWPARCGEWMKSVGLLGAQPASGVKKN